MRATLAACIWCNFFTGVMWSVHYLLIWASSNLMQMHDNFEGFPLFFCALFGLVSYNGPCFMTPFIGVSAFWVMKFDLSKVWMEFLRTPDLPKNLVFVSVYFSLSSMVNHY